MDYRRLPKLELHLHLDCSLSFNAVARLVPAITHEEYAREYVAPARCTNLAEFLSCAPKGFQLMQTEESLQFVTEDLFEQLAADGVVYAEIRFAPLLHMQNGLSAERVVEIVEQKVEALIRGTGIQAGVILCTLRHFNREQSVATVELVRQFAGSRVVALDLAGDEAGFPLDAHVDAYRMAREWGLHRTAHAGEGCGPESVWETLRLLAPQRIGHGTRSHEDAALVELLRATGIHLELCPSSNVQIIPSIETMANHPIDQLYRRGVQLSVSTDSRMLTPTTLTREYEMLHETFGWTEEEFLRTNLMALDAAFAGNEVKEAVRKRITEGYRRVDPAS